MLIRIFSALLALLVAAAACDSPTEEDSVAVGEVEVRTPTHTLGAGDTLRLTAVVRDSSGTVLPDYPVRWESLDTTTATVSQTGLVTGRRAGLVWVTANAGGKKGGVSLQVYQARLVLVPDSLVFPSGGTSQWLYARTYDGSAQLLGETAQFSVLDTTVVGLTPCGAACTGTSRGTTVMVHRKNPGATHIVASWKGVADTASVRVLP